MNDMATAAAMLGERAATTEDMANPIRALAMDAVQAANSGHPGLPMGMANVATVLFAIGSEVGVALAASDRLATEGVRAAVVSAPCWELFREKSEAYRREVLGHAPRVGVEAALEGDWARWLGERGAFVGMKGFGASAPAETLFEESGITPDAAARAARRLIGQ